MKFWIFLDNLLAERTNKWVFNKMYLQVFSRKTANADFIIILDVV